MSEAGRVKWDKKGIFLEISFLLLSWLASSGFVAHWLDTSVFQHFEVLSIHLYLRDMIMDWQVLNPCESGNYSRLTNPNSHRVNWCWSRPRFRSLQQQLLRLDISLSPIACVTRIRLDSFNVYQVYRSLVMIWFLSSIYSASSHGRIPVFLKMGGWMDGRIYGVDDSISPLSELVGTMGAIQVDMTTGCEHVMSHLT